MANKSNFTQIKKHWHNLFRAAIKWAKKEDNSIYSKKVARARFLMWKLEEHTFFSIGWFQNYFLRLTLFFGAILIVFARRGIFGFMNYSWN